jgi:pectinesterase
VRGLIVVGCIAVAALAAGAQTAKKPVVTVGSDGQFTTVQAAVDAAPEQGEVIRIAPGTYKEKLHIDKNGIELRGTGALPKDVLLTYDDSAKSAGGTNKSFSVAVTGDDFYAENLTIQNDWEKKNQRMGEGAQAVALMITGDREVLRHVRLLGYQDTLYATSKLCHVPGDKGTEACHSSRQLFEDCYIEGHVDFIFGDSKAVFKNCEIHGMTHPVIALTAQSKAYPLEDSGYLFLHCTITADVAVDKMYFGRPWRAYSTVYFVDTELKGSVIQPEGWSEWKNPDGTGKLATSTYGDYGTHDVNGPVKTDQRIAPSKVLTKAEADKLTVGSWLEGWDAEKVR